MSQNSKERTHIMILIAIIVVLVISNIAIYYRVYLPNTRAVQVYGSSEEDIVDVPGYVIFLSLSEHPIGEVYIPNHNEEITFTLPPGKEAVISTPIPERISSLIELKPKYLVRKFTPITIDAKISRPEGTRIPERLFPYKESPYLADVYTLLAYKEHYIIEVIPFFYQDDTDYRLINRMLVFDNPDRILTNQTIHLTYSHLIGEGVIGGPEVMKLRVSSLNSNVINYIRTYYPDADLLRTNFVNDSWVSDRLDIYTYHIQEIE